MKRILGPLRLSSSLAIQNLLANRTRSLILLFCFLTGALATITVFGILRHMKAALETTMEQIGGITMIYYEEKPVKRQRTGKESVMEGRSPGLLPSQIEYIEKNIPGIRFTIPRYSDGQWVASLEGGKAEAWSVAINPHYFEVYMKDKLQEGRYFNQEEYDNADPVCIIGMGHKERLFSGKPCLGKIVLVDGIPLKIIGVHKGGGVLYYSLPILWNNFRSRHQSIYKCEFFCENTAAVKPAFKMIKRYLLQEHRGVEEFDLDTALNSRKELEDEIQSSLSLVLTLGVLILFLCLIGVVNINVSDMFRRVREIGIMKALGGNERQVFLQYAVEILIPGLVGTGLGLSLAGLIAQWEVFPWKSDFQVEDMALTTVSLILIGCVSSLVPAIFAARLNPAEAIRTAK